MTPKQFIEKIADAAVTYYRKHGVFASITIAQAALESGWGRYIPKDKHTGKESYNIFGIKGTGPAGSVVCDTKEFYGGKMQTIESRFRAYNSWAESIADHNKLLLTSRYKPVLQAKNYQEAAVRLQQCGYATDPGYAQKLIQIIDEHGLNKYDVKPEHWAQKDIDLLLNNGIINQMRAPDTPVKWGEFAAVINRIRRGQ